MEIGYLVQRKFGFRKIVVRRRGQDEIGQTEVLAAQRISHESDSFLWAIIDYMVSGMARRCQYMQSAMANIYDITGIHRHDRIVFRIYGEQFPYLMETASVGSPDALVESFRSSEMMGAFAVDIYAHSRVVSHQIARTSGVVQVNVGQSCNVDVRGCQAHLSQGRHQFRVLEGKTAFNESGVIIKDHIARANAIEENHKQIRGHFFNMEHNGLGWNPVLIDGYGFGGEAVQGTMDKLR